MKNLFNWECLTTLGHKKTKPRLRLTCVGEGGLEPPNGYPDRFTVCCNCHYATPPL